MLILYGFESDKKLDDAGYENAKSIVKWRLQILLSDGTVLTNIMNVLSMS